MNSFLRRLSGILIFIGVITLIFVLGDTSVCSAQTNSPTNIYTTNVLIDGSFENSPTNINYSNPGYAWTGGGNFTVLRGYLDGVPAEDGAQLLGFNTGGTQPNGWIQQTVQVTPNETYQFNFWAVTAGANGPVALQASIIENGTTTISLIASPFGTYDQNINQDYPVGTWVQYALQYTASTNQVTIRFDDVSTVNSSADIGLDNVTLVDTTYSFITNGSSITIEGYNGSNSTLTIPSTINGLPVTSIDSSAFRSRSANGNANSYIGNVTNITIPSGVTSIGDYAFSGCTGLNSITIPDSVVSIGLNAFQGDTNLTNLNVSSDLKTFIFQGASYLGLNAALAQSFDTNTDADIYSLVTVTMLSDSNFLSSFASNSNFLNTLSNNFVGPQGPIGLTGSNGAVGPQGPIGLTGSTGSQGPVGLAGATGPVGPQGPMGLTGPQGPQGIQGPQGLPGSNGKDGAPGIQGPSGVVVPESLLTNTALLQALATNPTFDSTLATNTAFLSIVVTNPVLLNALIANTNFVASLSSQMFAVETNNVGSLKAAQSITFSAITSPRFTPNKSLTLRASSSSGLVPIIFTSSVSNVATVSNNTLTLTGSGTTTLKAIQLGNADYAPAVAIQILKVK